MYFSTFCFSIAMMLGLRKGILALTAFFLVSVISHFAIGTRSPALFVFTNSLLLEFLLGAWLAYAVVSQARLSSTDCNQCNRPRWCRLFGGIIFGFDCFVGADVGDPSALLVGGLVFCERNRRIPAFMRKLSFLGDSSYSLYLLHVLLIDAVILLAIYAAVLMFAKVSHIELFGTILVCGVISIYCIVVALISYQLIESRLTKGLRSVSLAKLYRRAG